MYAVIRVRGSVNTPKAVRDTLQMLRLTRVNHCVVIPKNPDYEGMLRKAQGYVTWGEVTEEMLERMLEKRGRLPGDIRIDPKKAKELTRKIMKGSAKDIDIKQVFRLSPPTKGYRSVRISYPRGDLGKRGEAINELLKRMI